MLIAGRYVDHFRRHEGRWKILRRTVVFDNSTMFAVPPGGANLGPDWAQSTRGADDPLWRLMADLGLPK